jgi:hypothetical protein
MYQKYSNEIVAQKSQVKQSPKQWSIPRALAEAVCQGGKA